jgi:arginase family enzyme
VEAFMPEPGGPSGAEVEAILQRVARSCEVVGAGVSGLGPAGRNVEPVSRLLRALTL